MTALYDWKLKRDSENYLYCVGFKPDGTPWETGSIQSMEMDEQCYVVRTHRSVYYLYW
jgi:uncharacterized secreted protein with C-terminal beta-propeller domain